MQSNIQNEIEEFETHLKITRDFLEKLPGQLQFLTQELKSLEDESQDLLHYAELGRFNASEGYSIASELKRVRQERRRVKNLLELAQAVSNRIDGKFKHVSVLNKALGDVRHVINKQNRRYYHPRVREDLKEKINA